MLGICIWSFQGTLRRVFSSEPVLAFNQGLLTGCALDNSYLVSECVYAYRVENTGWIVAIYHQGQKISGKWLDPRFLLQDAQSVSISSIVASLQAWGVVQEPEHLRTISSPPLNPQMTTGCDLDTAIVKDSRITNLMVLLMFLAISLGSAVVAVLTASVLMLWASIGGTVLTIFLMWLLGKRPQSCSIMLAALDDHLVGSCLTVTGPTKCFEYRIINVSGGGSQVKSTDIKLYLNGKEAGSFGIQMANFTEQNPVRLTHKNKILGGVSRDAMEQALQGLGISPTVTGGGLF